MDEILIHVAPILIGDGISREVMEPVRLEKTEVWSSADHQHALRLAG